jgi:ankyrin repeat protein
MVKKSKSRETLDEILASCSDSLFPHLMGVEPVNLQSVAADGDTPLHEMLWRKKSYAVLELIKAGADVNAAGDMSETLLHIAVDQQNMPVIEALLKAGADPNYVSEFGHSPRECAVKIGGEIQRLFRNR